MAPRNAGRMLVGMALAATLIVDASAGTREEQERASARLEEIGLRLDGARELVAAERGPALERMAAELGEVLGSKLPTERREAAYFLAAEIHFALGNAAEAEKSYRKAARNEGLEDVSEAGAIRARELAGRDAEAAKQWREWQKEFAASPLVPEARLAAAWNAVRRDSLAEATALLETLRAEAPWMNADPRVALAEATVHYLEGRPAEALAILPEDASDAAALYLRGLAHRERGDALVAAARFQEVTERHPDSPLRDLALLAKADIFLDSRAWRSAADEFARVAELAHREDVRAEADLRRAAAVLLDGDAEGGVDHLRSVVSAWPGTSAAARAQYLLGEALWAEERYDEAIAAFNGVLTSYFDHELAARAQYRVGRSLDALGRGTEATSAYQAVVSGYTQSPEAPAAAYLAAVGLLDMGRPLDAAPYFQIVLDRYTIQDGETVSFATPEHRELVEAALCLLQLSYHRAGDLGQLCGVPHLLLAKMPPSESPWRAHALLIDADALASLSRFEEAQATLETLLEEFASSPVAVPANRLLAWTYARQGQHERALATEERMLERYEQLEDVESVSAALLHKAHILFNEKRYEGAAATYDQFAARFPDHPERPTALYQGGLCHLRLGNTGDAVDRWEEVVALDPASDLASKAWARAGDLYFQAEHYEDAKRCYAGLLQHFGGADTEARALLRIAQCEYNAGNDAEALQGFSEVATRFGDAPIAREAERGIELALYRLGQREDGAEVLAALVEQYPSSSFAADAQFEIALRRYEAEDWTAAADEFRRVVTQFPSFSAADRAHYLMADAYERSGQAKRAREAYEQFLFFFASSEFRPATQFRLGSLRFEEGDYMRAAVDFTTVLEEDVSPETRLASLYNLALCHVLLSQAEEARATLEQFRAQLGGRDERVADVAYRIGELDERSGRWEQAVAGYEDALASGAPSSLKPELYYRIGTCRESLADADGAIGAYRKAVATDIRDDAYRLSAAARLAVLHEERGEWAQAAETYRQIARDAEDPELASAARERAEQLKQFIN